MAQLHLPSPRAMFIVLLAGGLALAATACGSVAQNLHPIPAAGSGGAGMQHGTSSARSAQPAEFDQQFIDMMVPHHEGAVEMARIAQARAEHQEIRSMAEEIIQSQSTEIEQMKAWRRAWYGSDQTPAMDEMPMLHDMPGTGDMAMTMNMAQEVELLRGAPEPFDLAFIDAMIPHHQSAIDAARLALRQAVHPELQGLAAAIIGDQQREIDQMTSWRLTWYGTSAPSEAPRDMPIDMPGMGH